MKGRGQGSPLAADRDVTVAEIRHHGNAAAGGDSRRIAQLKAVWCRAIRVMTNGLAMAADGFHGILASCLQQVHGAASELFTKFVVQRERKLEITVAGLQAIEPPSQGFGQRQAVGGEQPMIPAAGVELGQHAVDGVLAGSAHEPDIELRRRFTHGIGAAFDAATWRLASVSSFATHGPICLAKCRR
ncbi:MAG: hypothetical protein Kow0073_06970 [Immundisolibacter sp.]